ncbi:MAG TPA: RNA polymerase sigma-70 factor [Bacteroidales bacterium]|nr:RNA polymerase sigma-70 factor [Bacteroidales bacterium]
MNARKLILEQFLVKKLIAGDSVAFSDIFTAYYKDLVLFAFSLTKDLCAAEDIVQETFVKLWEDHETIDIKSSLKSLLIKSVQNRFIDWYRHKKVVNNYADHILNQSPLIEVDTDSYLLRSELEGNIEMAVSNLPGKIKEAYQLSRVEGLKYREIAQKLNVSERTVEVRISKALQILRENLKALFN